MFALVVDWSFGLSVLAVSPGGVMALSSGGHFALSCRASICPMGSHFLYFYQKGKQEPYHAKYFLKSIYDLHQENQT